MSEHQESVRLKERQILRVFFFESIFRNIRWNVRRGVIPASVSAQHLFGGATQERHEMAFRAIWETRAHKEKGHMG